MEWKLPCKRGNKPWNCLSVILNGNPQTSFIHLGLYILVLKKKVQTRKASMAWTTDSIKSKNFITAQPCKPTIFTMRANLVPGWHCFICGILRRPVPRNNFRNEIKQWCPSCLYWLNAFARLCLTSVPYERSYTFYHMPRWQKHEMANTIH